MAGSLSAAAAPECPPGSPARSEAEQTFRGLDSRIRSLRESKDLEGAQLQIVSLLGRPCFSLAAENRRLPRADNVVALKTWWLDGGALWVHSYLLAPSEAGRVVVPPDLRRSLSRSEQPHHPLAFLLCTTDDPDCGAETRGWLRRASEGLRAQPLCEIGTPPSLPPADVACASVLKGKAPTYRAWRECLEEHRNVVPALPLGSFRSPRVGWLVLRGRRGHYQSCDELRAYDLATGAAYLAQRCAGTAAPAIQVRQGRLSLDNLREAALLLLLGTEVERVQTMAESYDLPRTLVRTWPETSTLHTSGSGCGFASSEQTLLTWVLTDSAGTKTLLTGSLPWPSSDQPGLSFAAALLAVAEDGMTQGAPPAPLPGAARQAGYELFFDAMRSHGRLH